MPTDSHPAAYLRRSYVDDNSPGDISREAQRAAVRSLAAADGHNGDLIEYDDWGISADIAKAGKRTAYARLLADMEAGAVSAVYAFDVDRLYRDPRDLIRLQDAAQRHGVTITTTSGRLAISDGDDPAAEGFAFIGAVFGRMELQKAKKRARAARDARLARGDVLGRPPFGYRHGRAAGGRVIWVRDPEQEIEPVLEAFGEAGSFHGAAALLNERGIAAPRGGVWAGNVVNKIVRREQPGVGRRGRNVARVAARGSQRFSRLLRCHCGTFLTPRVNRTRTQYGSYGPYVSYQCHRGRYDPAHHRPHMVQESIILPWVQAEAARVAVPFDAVQMAEAAAGERAALESQRERLGYAVVDGLLSREAAKERAAAIDTALAALADREAAVDVDTTIDWSAPPAVVNGVLRALWDHVQLDETMRPVAAEWRVPEWRQG